MPTLPPLMPPPISAGSGWRKRKQQPKYEDIAIGAELKGKVMHPPPIGGLTDPARQLRSRQGSAGGRAGNQDRSGFPDATGP